MWFPREFDLTDENGAGKLVLAPKVNVWVHGDGSAGAQALFWKFRFRYTKVDIQALLLYANNFTSS